MTAYYYTPYSSSVRVYKSSNGGANWSFSSNWSSWSSSSITPVVVDPNTPNTVYGGANRSGIYKSTNGGDQWMKLDNGPTDWIEYIAPDPSNSKKLYAVGRVEGSYEFYEIPPNIPPCAITEVTAGEQSECDPQTNTYSQEVTVTYANAPEGGSLVVNEQSFTITASPQSVTLLDLVADGLPVNVSASFSDDPACSLSVGELFTAPENCEPALSHEFFLLSDMDVRISAATAVDGDIHANDDVDINRGTQPFTAFSGNITAVDDIDIASRNTINGDVTAGDDLDNDGTINGTATANGSVAPEAIGPVIPFVAGGSDFTVQGNEDKALPPGQLRGCSREAGRHAPFKQRRIFYERAGIRD